MMRRLGWLLLLAGLAGIVACFSLSFQNGSIKCSNDPQRLCPSGYVCVSGYCWSRLTDFSIVSDGGGSFDGGTD